MRTQKGNTHYYYDTANNLIAMVKGNDTLHFYYDISNSPIAFTRNNTMYYYVKNIQGDIIKLVNEDGCLAYTYDYDAWGALISIQNNQGHVIPSTGNSLATTNPLRYRGYVYDDETGLYYLQSRYYDPKTGRFINADIYFDTESGSPLSTNMFAYCENNSIYSVDFSGYWFEDLPNTGKGIWYYDLDDYNLHLRNIEIQLKNTKINHIFLKSLYDKQKRLLNKAKENYAMNKSTLSLNKCKYDYIYNQYTYDTNYTAGKVIYGNGYSVMKGGCTAVALYNMMLTKVRFLNFADLILVLELNGYTTQ